MACNFSIPFSGSPDQVVKKAKSAVQGQGGSFTGDTNRGEFSVKVFGNSLGGTYVVGANELQVTITDKPLLLSCGMIENYLKSQIK